MKYINSATIWLLMAAAASGQDTVVYRSRSLATPKAPRTIKGKIESDTVAGVRIDGQTISSADIIDVKYEAPGQVSFDLPKAINAESMQKYDEAIKEYRGLIASAAAPNWAPLRRQFDYRIALATVAKAEQIGDAKSAIDAAKEFIRQHPDCWQRAPATHLLARLFLDQSPQDTTSALQVLDALAAMSALPDDMKIETALSAVDVEFGRKNWDEARKRLARITANDPRVALYQLACNADVAAIERLRLAAETGEDRLRPTAYNLLGDVYLADPKRAKDALFAYLWVDVVYDRDPRETAKAQERLALVFKEMKDESRFLQYRNKARGR